MNIEQHQRINVIVNGREMSVYGEMTILQSLIQEGIHIPHLCYDIRLERANGNCGLCVVELGNGERDVKACQTPIKEGMVITTMSEYLEHYRKVRLEQLLSDHNADCIAPCKSTCPANIDIQAYLLQVQSGNYEAALRIIKDRNPFPLVCGRVCPHPCEVACRRNLIDSPVAINHVKRFAADWDMAQKRPWIPRCKQPSSKKVAVVGAGPSGLSCAYYLTIEGHQVTVFERQPYAGGMMRYGIPEYRLPKAILDREIDIMKKMGVTIQCGISLGTHVRLEDLHDDFDAVYLAIGSWRATPLQIEGESSEGVWLGINYLERVTHSGSVHVGKDVLVIGGGNTAIDCVRTAKRTGATNVKLIYRRTRDEMPAEPYEVEEAIHEGVEMEFLAAPVRIVPEGGRKKVHFIRMKLGEPDRSGRRRPVPVDGSEFIIEADTVIGAIGQSTNTQFLYNDYPVKLNKWGDIEVNEKTMQTSDAKIFAGGDCVSGPATVVQAVGAGRRAAEAINCLLSKGYVKEDNAHYYCSRGTLEDLPRWEFEEMPRILRASMPAISLQERNNNFQEIETGLTEKQARDEAARCLKCGCNERYDCSLRKEAHMHGVQYRKPAHDRPYIPVVNDHPFIVRDHNKCISCGRCIATCAEIEGPDVLSYYLRQGRLLVGTKTGLPLEKTDCVSCGQCVNACPCGALDFRGERDKVFAAINDPDKIVVGFVAPAVRSVVSDYFGIPFDEASPFIAGLLKQLRFDKVFDFTFAADLTIVEETTEFLNRVGAKGVMPQFTSCCPAWVNFVERRYPELIPHLSTCKSPQQMMGATVRNHFSEWAKIPKEKLFIVSIVPCLAKKVEAARPEFITNEMRDVDAVMTSGELIEMVKLNRLDISSIIPSQFDEPYRQVSGAGILFGASGGVAEASLRMAVEKLTGNIHREHLDFEEIRGFAGVKEAMVVAGDKKLRVAVISGLHNAEPVIEKIIEGKRVGYDLIEVMACPGGCICGAGHPVPEKIDTLQNRQKVLVNIDKTSQYRKSQENPDILRLYAEFYGSANSEKAHHLLHTTYKSRKKDARELLSSRMMADSAYRVHNISVCICNDCARKGSDELYSSLVEHVSKSKMDPFINVTSIRLNEGHGPIHLTFNNKLIAREELESLYRLILSRDVTG
jgi:formate dehydrogenase major subunit